LNWGAQNWTQYSRWGLTRAEQRGRRTSLDLLATLLLMHPRIPLAFLATRAHWWLMVIFSSTSTLISLSTELLCSRSALSLYWCMGLFLPRCRTLHHDGKCQKSILGIRFLSPMYNMLQKLPTPALYSPSRPTTKHLLPRPVRFKTQNQGK